MISNHPLKNEEVIDYIKDIENKYTIEQVLAWLNITSELMNEEKNKTTILAIKEYKKELNNMLSKSQTLRRVSVTESLKLLNIEWRH